MVEGVDGSKMKFNKGRVAILTIDGGGGELHFLYCYLKEMNVSL